MIKMIKMTKSFGNGLYGPSGKFLIPSLEVRLGEKLLRFRGIAIIDGRIARQTKSGYFKFVFSGKHCFPGQMF